jgi:hypothetical protein
MYLVRAGLFLRVDALRVHSRLAVTREHVVADAAVNEK